MQHDDAAHHLIPKRAAVQNQPLHVYRMPYPPLLQRFGANFTRHRHAGAATPPSKSPDGPQAAADP